MAEGTLTHNEYMEDIERREEEEKARRAALEAEIARREAKIQEVRGIIGELEAEKTKLCNQIKAYEEQRLAYNSGILSQVIMLNVFEGVCADVTQEQLGSSITVMEQVCNNAGKLEEQVNLQIERLYEQIADIEEEIERLRGLF